MHFAVRSETLQLDMEWAVFKCGRITLANFNYILVQFSTQSTFFLGENVTNVMLFVFLITNI